MFNVQKLSTYKGKRMNMMSMINNPIKINEVIT